MYKVAEVKLNNNLTSILIKICNGFLFLQNKYLISDYVSIRIDMHLFVGM